MVVQQGAVGGGDGSDFLTRRSRWIVIGLQEFGPADSSARILDPFGETGTSFVCLRGHSQMLGDDKTHL